LPRLSQQSVLTQRLKILQSWPQSIIMSSPKRAKLTLSAKEVMESDCSKAVCDKKVDIFSELCKRNIEHAIDIIVENADFQSIVRMRQVSKEWKRIIDSYDNPWQMMLMKKLKDNPDFAAASDLLDWTRYIISSDPAHHARVKYIAYMGTYITEKQRMLRRSGGQDESALKLELNMSTSVPSVKEMGGWLFVNDRKLSAWDLSCERLQKEPQKTFEAPLSPWPYFEWAQEQLEGWICCFTSNAEAEPWQTLKTVAAGCGYWDEKGMADCYIVWDFNTGEVLRRVKSDNKELDRIRMDTSLIATVNRGRHDGMWHMSIYNNELEFIRGLCAFPDSHYSLLIDDKKVYVVALAIEHEQQLWLPIRREIYRFSYDGQHPSGPSEESLHDIPDHLTENLVCFRISKIFGNLALAKGYVEPRNGLRDQTQYKLLDIHDLDDPECISNKVFVRGKNREEPGLHLLRNGLLLVSDKVVPFPLEDVLSGYRKGIFDSKCAQLEGVPHSDGSDQETRETDGEGYAQLEAKSSSPTFIVTTESTGETKLKITAIDLRKVKPKLH